MPASDTAGQARIWPINAKIVGPEHRGTFQIEPLCNLENHRPEASDPGRYRAQYFDRSPTQESNPRDHYRYDQSDQQPDHEFSSRPSGRRPRSDSRIFQVDGSKIVHSFFTIDWAINNFKE
jgi:hypothetical protein